MIPTNITSPKDIIVFFGLLAVIIVTVGLGIESVNSNQDADVNTSFYRNVRMTINSEEGLKGTADSLSQGISGQEGASNVPSEEGLIVQGFNSLLTIGKTFKITASATNEASTILGLDPIYWLLFTIVFLGSFAVVTISYLKFKSG